MRSRVSAIVLAITRGPSDAHYGNELISAVSTKLPQLLPSDVKLVSATAETDWIAAALFPLFMRPTAEVRSVSGLGIPETARLDFTFECSDDLRYQKMDWIGPLIETAQSRFRVAASYVLYVVKSPDLKVATNFRLSTPKRSTDSDDDSGVRPTMEVATLLDHHLYGTGPTVGDYPLLAKLVLL